MMGSSCVKSDPIPTTIVASSPKEKITFKHAKRNDDKATEDQTHQHTLNQQEQKSRTNIKKGPLSNESLNEEIPGGRMIDTDLSECGDIKTCQHIKVLSETIKKHKNDDIGADSNDLLNMLNAFYHSLYYHDNNDDDFQYIYKLFGGECTLSKCNSIRREYKYAYGDKNDSNSTSMMNEYFDIIHCHYQHGYDRYRLTPKEKKEINETEMKNVPYINDDETFESNTDKVKVSKLQKILKTKKEILNKQANINLKIESNKFVSDLGQMKQADDEKKEKSTASYSYSFNFNYWSHCQESHHLSADNIRKIKDLYVAPKYKSLKDEVLNNEIFTLALNYWNEQVKKAQTLQKCVPYLKAKADVENYAKEFLSHPCHPSKFSYKDGDLMSLSHLLVIIIYCATNDFQSKFSSTYRAWSDTDNFFLIKKRHCNFHHFAKHLKEAVEVFGTQYKYGKVKVMYHGINREMLFNEMQPNIYTVMSTTSAINVAVNFSNNTGLVLQMIPHAKLKYFNCVWLSRYPNEEECLFVGNLSKHSINIINITNTFTGANFQPFITSLRIINSMINANYFQHDCTIIHKIIQKNTCTLSLLSDDDDDDDAYTDIGPKIKKLTKILIEHQCSKYDADKYKKQKNVHPYIDKLVNHFFVNQKIFAVDWKTMNKDILKQYDVDSNGYIGYSFLNSYFCQPNYQGLKFAFINILFPSLRFIKIDNLSSFNTNLINDIVKFIESDKQSPNSNDIKQIRLGTSQEFGASNIMQQYKNYKVEFLKLGWDIRINEKPYYIDIQKEDVVLVNDKGERVTTDKLQDTTGTLKTVISNKDDNKIPQQAHVLHEQGRMLGGSGLYDKSLELLFAAHKIAPKWPYPLYDIAYTYLLQQDFENALKYYQLTDDLSPNGFYTSKTALWGLKNELVNKVFPIGLYHTYQLAEFMDKKMSSQIYFGIAEKYPLYAPAWCKLAATDIVVDEFREKAIEIGIELINNKDGPGVDAETKGMLYLHKATILSSKKKEYEKAKDVLKNLLLSVDLTDFNESRAKLLLNNILQNEQKWKKDDQQAEEKKDEDKKENEQQQNDENVINKSSQADDV